VNLARSTINGGGCGPLPKEMLVDPKEVARLQAYLRKTFGTPSLEVRARPKKKDSAEVFVNGEFIAVLFREEEEGEVSYQFQMAILDLDLEQA
jgi:hypothetical protein